MNKELNTPLGKAKYANYANYQFSLTTEQQIELKVFLIAVTLVSPKMRTALRTWNILHALHRDAEWTEQPVHRLISDAEAPNDEDNNEQG